MPFYEAPGVAQLVLSGQYGTSEAIVSVVHVQRRGELLFTAWTQAQLRDAASRLSVGWQRFLPQLAAEAKWTEIKGRDLTSATGAVDLFSVPLQGLATGTALPPNVTALVQWRTGKAGRGANGRTYLPGALESVIDALGRTTAAYQTDMTTRAQGVITDLGAVATSALPGAPLDMVILHKARGVPLTRSADPVLIGRLSNLVGTQRRRLPKRA
jgi:hypothetical protein